MPFTFHLVRAIEPDLTDIEVKLRAIGFDAEADILSGITERLQQDRDLMTRLVKYAEDNSARWARTSRVTCALCIAAAVLNISSLVMRWIGS